MKRIALALVALAALASRASAGAIASCIDPFAFANADVNVIVLPYFQAGTAQRPLNGLGSQLALLLKLEVLYRSMSYDHWGVVLLTGKKEECDPARVVNMLVERKMIRPGGRAVIVTGRVYQQDADVYVQTYAKTFRNPAAGETAAPVDVTVQLAGKTFQGRIGSTEFAFPPQQLSVEFINTVADNFSKAVFLYDKPSLTSAKHPLRLDDFRKCDNCPNSLAFSVLGREGSWIHVRMQGTDNRDGYLAARPDNANTLDDRMPEVSFIQGLMGFVRYTGQPQPTATAIGLQAATDAFASYVRRAQLETEPEATAGAMQLSAILDYVRTRIAPRPTAPIVAASLRLDSAYQLVPYDADVRNTAAVFRLLRAYNAGGRGIRARDVADDFIAAAALDPKNLLPLANLQSFYELVSLPATAAKLDASSVIDPGEVQTQLARVKAIRERISSTSGPR